jgi:hypothetical protein
MNWEQELRKQCHKINYRGILQYMKLVGWTWSGKETLTPMDLYNKITDIFWMAVDGFEKNGTHSICSTGGFTVIICSFGEEKPFIKILFDISQFDTTLSQGLKNFIDPD